MAKIRPVKEDGTEDYLRSTERLVDDLNQRVLRVRNPDLKDRCVSLSLQLALAFGLDEHAIESSRKAVGT